MEKIRERIEALAKKDARFDNPRFNVCDWSGGNYDDAYSMGCSDGEIVLARELLALLGDKPAA